MDTAVVTASVTIKKLDTVHTVGCFCPATHISATTVLRSNRDNMLDHAHECDGKHSPAAQINHMEVDLWIQITHLFRQILGMKMIKN